MKVQQGASLHEKAVQKVAKGDVHLPRQRPTRGRQRLPGTSLRVHPEVWRMVRELSINSAHIQVLSETDVIVWNHPGPWPR
jgi:hypothetical protein